MGDSSPYTPYVPPPGPPSVKDQMGPEPPLPPNKPATEVLYDTWWNPATYHPTQAFGSLLQSYSDFVKHVGELCGNPSSSPSFDKEKCRDREKQKFMESVTGVPKPGFSVSPGIENASPALVGTYTLGK